MSTPTSNQYPSLQNRVVFISGGASGIGAAMVEAFCRQGARVAFVDILDSEAESLVSNLADQDGLHPPVFYHCDLEDISALKKVIQQVKDELGPVSVLINNAASDMRHAFFAIQAVSEHMQTLGGGSIINFGSMSWYECQGNMTGYTTSKAGMEGMTRGLARDLGEHNIRINTLVPGWVMTERQLRDWVDESTQEEINRSQCLKQPLMPQDICAMALFLASDDSRMCTAQHYIVDGGWI